MAIHFFSKLDHSKGYHKIHINPCSCGLATLATHWQIFRDTRSIFSISSTAPFYQREIAGIVGRLQRQTQMNYLREKTTDWSKGTKFYKKFEFMKSEILYMGHKLSSVRFLPHQNKINAITLLQLPTNVKDLRLFLGKTTYSFKFLFNFVTLTYALIYSKKYHVKLCIRTKVRS